MVFDRLHERIKSRAEEATAWRRLFANILVAANGSAGAATLAFIGAVYSKGPGSAPPAKFGFAALFFIFGFLASVIMLAIIYTRARGTLIADSEYLQDVLSDQEPVRWHDNPRIQRLSPIKYFFALLFGGVSFACFCIGVVMALVLLTFFWT